ncbi:MAG TPA: SURF1 family protein [Acidiferrobacteraceae bacterium]|nr:SURF1 family protein [Acidiferrobacteraceae bacterium]
MIIVPRRIRLLPLLLAVFLGAVFVGLGVWQLQRAEQKEQLQNRYADRRSAPALRIGPESIGIEDLDFRKVRMRGYFEVRNQFYLSNKLHEHRLGYHVVAPFRFQGSNAAVLVNLGWVPHRSADPNELPPVVIPQAQMELTGSVYRPIRNRFVETEPRVRQETWPLLWPQMNIQYFAERVSYQVLPFIVLLDPKQSSVGFVREWPRPQLRPERNLGYAFQWFAMALAVMITYVVLGLRRRRKFLHS